MGSCGGHRKLIWCEKLFSIILTDSVNLWFSYFQFILKFSPCVSCFAFHFLPLSFSCLFYVFTCAPSINNPLCIQVLVSPSLSVSSFCSVLSFLSVSCLLCTSWCCLLYHCFLGLYFYLVFVFCSYYFLCFALPALSVLLYFVVRFCDRKLYFVFDGLWFTALFNKAYLMFV